MGRPRIKLEDLKEDWQERILELSKEGASIVELAVELEISRQTLYTLMEREPIFLDTIKRCKELCEYWWLREGRINLKDKDFSYTGWYMNMKNRFGWADKTENKTNHSGSVQTGGPDLSKLSKKELKEYFELQKKMK